MQQTGAGQLCLTGRGQVWDAARVGDGPAPGRTRAGRTRAREKEEHGGAAKARPTTPEEHSARRREKVPSHKMSVEVVAFEMSKGFGDRRGVAREKVQQKTSRMKFPGPRQLGATVSRQPPGRSCRGQGSCLLEVARWPGN